MGPRIVIIVALVALVGLGAYAFLRPAPEPVETPEEELPLEQVEEPDFSSAEYGIAFDYPQERYQLTARQEGPGPEGQEWVSLVLTERTEAPRGEGTEGPPVIAVLIVPAKEGQSLEQWVRTNPLSNFALATPEVLVPTTVGGEAGLAYTHTGLYESDAVAVMHDGKVYLFTAGWITAEDRMRTDFRQMLETVEFDL